MYLGKSFYIISIASTASEIYSVGNPLISISPKVLKVSPKLSPSNFSTYYNMKLPPSKLSSCNGES